MILKKPLTGKALAELVSTYGTIYVDDIELKDGETKIRDLVGNKRVQKLTWWKHYRDPCVILRYGSRPTCSMGFDPRNRVGHRKCTQLVLKAYSINK